MSETPNNQLPYAPENVLDPAVPQNLLADAVDTRLQLAVLAIQDAPPGSAANGDRFIVGAGTGDWTGEDGRVARYVADPGYWQFADARIALNLADGLLYVRGPGGWAIANRPDPLPAVAGDKATSLTAVVTSMLAALDGVMWDDQTT